MLALFPSLPFRISTTEELYHNDGYQRKLSTYLVSPFWDIEEVLPDLQICLSESKSGE
jgi:hypothetical protein